MWRYYLLLTDLTPQQIDEQKKSVASGQSHPLDLKKALARRIITDFHGADAAAQAQKDFEAQFQKDALPSDLPTAVLSDHSPRKLFRLLAEVKLFPTNAEAQRKIKEGAVSMAAPDAAPPNWERLTDPTWEFNPRHHPTVVFRVGRRLLRVVFSSQRS